ncbi:MAG: hypothetical protein V1796_02360, partial [Pseudomonadota bacterium]
GSYDRCRLTTQCAGSTPYPDARGGTSTGSSPGCRKLQSSGGFSRVEGEKESLQSRCEATK